MASTPNTSNSTPATNRPIAIDLDHDGQPNATAPADVFLTPRVVDETAFDRFAGDLRRLIQDAANAGRALVRTGSETDRHLGAMRDAAKELRTQVETGARLIPTIDQRLTRIEDALAKTESRADLEASVAERIDAIVNERLEAATTKAAAVAQRMGGAIEQASELTTTLTERLDRATTAATDAAERTERITAALTDHADRAETMLERLTATIDTSEERLGQALTEAEIAAGALTATVAQVAGEITPHVEAARALIADARATAADPELTEAVKTGEAAKRTLLRAIREAKSIVEQTDLARRQLADDLEQATTQIDAVSRREPTPAAETNATKNANTTTDTNATTTDTPAATNTPTIRFPRADA